MAKDKSGSLLTRTQGEISMPDTPAPPSKCIVCLKELPTGAQKCTECDSYQDLRRHVFAWSGLLGALIGFVPLWSAAWSLGELAFPSVSEITLREVKCRPNGLSFIVQNSGGQRAQLFDPELKLSRDGHTKDLDFGLSVPTENAKIEANDLIRLNFDFRPGQTLPVQSISTNCVIAISLKSIDAAAKNAAVVGDSCPCSN